MVWKNGHDQQTSDFLSPDSSYRPGAMRFVLPSDTPLPHQMSAYSHEFLKVM
jgi:hypothetical protein